MIIVPIVFLFVTDNRGGNDIDVDYDDNDGDGYSYNDSDNSVETLMGWYDSDHSEYNIRDEGW
jgi:hypothetical protein